MGVADPPAIPLADGSLYHVKVLVRLIDIDNGSRLRINVDVVRRLDVGLYYLAARPGVPYELSADQQAAAGMVRPHLPEGTTTIPFPSISTIAGDVCGRKTPSTLPADMAVTASPGPMGSIFTLEMSTSLSFSHFSQDQVLDGARREGGYG